MEEFIMQLKKMSIINYRQFQDAIINFDGELTILAGANNSGKTSIIELFKRVFQDKNFTQDDISVKYYSELQDDFINTVTQLHDTSTSETEFRENVKQFFSAKEKNELAAIRIEIEVQYRKDESISLFSDYLMELDDACTSFYFSFNYEIDITELVKLLSLHTPELYNRKQEIYELEKIGKTKEKRTLLDELIVEYRNTLLEMLDSAFTNTVYFTDKNYKNPIKIGINEFQRLFKYNYLKATRLLNDEKTDNHFSISKELLNHFKQSDDWEVFKAQIIKDIKAGLEVRELNDQIKKHSLEKLKRLLIVSKNILTIIEGSFHYKQIFLMNCL